MFRVDSRQEAGLWLPAGDHTMARMLNKSAGLHERETVEAALERITDHRCAVDAGAHIGAITRQFAGRFDEVLAFEPDRGMFEYLGFNTANIGNVRRFPLALGNKVGPVRLSHQGVTHNSMGWVDQRNRPGRHWVMMVTLDSFELESLGLLKIDVEGGEVDVLKGARGTLLRCKPAVIIEENWCAGRAGHQVGDAAAFLTKLGALEVGRLQPLDDTENVIFAWPAVSGHEST
jgi:FkbM family methyltransferase